MQKFLLILVVGCGGFIGASLRYVISLNSAKTFGVDFPYGTLIANIIGAIIIGLVMELSLNSSLITPNVRLFLTTGMMGGLTTFSTFSFETVAMIMNGNAIVGSINIILNLGLSLVGVVIGQYIARLV